MLPGVLEGGTVLYPLGWRRCPHFMCALSLFRPSIPPKSHMCFEKLLKK